MHTTINYMVLTEGCTPTQGTPGAAGWDARAAESAVIAPGMYAGVRLGIALELPEGWECQVRPRSGLALKYGVTVLNAPGTIDADYRGELVAILINHGGAPFRIEKGDRVAQLVFKQTESIELNAVTSVSETQRSEGGFGHTGTK